MSSLDPRYSGIFRTGSYRVRDNRAVELHMLTGERDFQRTLWALKSFYCYSGLDPGLCLHNDGTLSGESLDILQHHFSGCLIPEHAAERTHQTLEGYPMCQFFRRKHPISGKLFDVLLYSRADYLLVVDSDILWFRESPQISRAVRTGKPFHVDASGEALARNRRFMEQRCGLFPAKGFNAGIMGFRRNAFLDIDFLEQALDKLVNVPRELLAESLGYPGPRTRTRAELQNPVESITWWVMEQTLYALLFGRCGDVVRLSVKSTHGNKAHPFVNEPITSETAMQHFISDRSWNAFFPVGVEYLLRNGFLEAWDAWRRE